MPQYDQTIERVSSNLSSANNIDGATQQAISSLLSTFEDEGYRGKSLKVERLSECYEPKEDDDMVVTRGVDVVNTSASIIVMEGLSPVVIDIDTPIEIGQRVVIGGDGADSVSILGGDSVVINAGAGNDSVTTGAGRDVVNGGVGNDSISTGAGADSVTVGQGADSVDTGLGFDSVLTVLDSDEADFTVDENGQIVITNIETNEITQIDNAEYLEFGDGAGHLVVGNNYKDDVLDDVFNTILSNTDENATPLLRAGAHLTNDELSDMISNYLASDQFNESSQGVTNLNDLVELIYEDTLGVEAESDELTNWVDLAKAELQDPSNRLDEIAAEIEATGDVVLIGQISSSDIDIGSI